MASEEELFRRAVADVRPLTTSNRAALRMALIHHGRDKQPRAPANLLRSYLARWLPHLDAVLAFHSAQVNHGGLASTYLLLRKSSKARQQTLERHQKRQP